MKINVADRLQHVEEYYFSIKLKEIADMRSQGISVINLGIGSPDLMPDTKVINRLITETQNPDLHGYQSYRGIPEFRQAIADWYLRKFNVKINAGTETLPLIGSKEGIMHISMTYLNPNDEVLIPNPGYPTYASVSALTGARAIPYDLIADNHWLPNLDKLADSDLSRVKIMWINYPHMPSGAVASQVFFEQLIAFAHKHNILICHDNPYTFILNDHPLSILSIDGGKDVAIELNSLSKTYNMAGWRIGFMAGHTDRIQEVLRFKSNMDSGMFKPLQLAAIEALQLSTGWHDGLNDVYASRRLMANKILIQLGCTIEPNQAGLFSWGKISASYKHSIELTDSLLKKVNIFITPGHIFGTNGEQYIRISLCNNQDVLQKALQRIEETNYFRTSPEV